MYNLTDQVSVITGGGRGIGLRIAEALASCGSNLILNGVTAANLEAAAQRISTNYGVRVVIVPGDVSNPDTSEHIARAAFANFRRLDVWVNNAGVLKDGLIGMIRQDDVLTTFGINTHGVIFGIQAAARVMRRGGRGSIINVSSIIGRVGNVGQVVYGASKAAVIGATLSAAKELAKDGIRVNAIAPGFISTDMTAAIAPNKFAERAAAIRLGRIGTAEDVAATAAFLASDASSYMTGQVLGVDGGMIV